MGFAEAPNLETVSEDPIRGTDLVRHTAAHFCPNCGSNLNLVDRDDWHRTCPDCEYLWVPAYEPIPIEELKANGNLDDESADSEGSERDESDNLEA